MNRRTIDSTAVLDYIFTRLSYLPHNTNTNTNTTVISIAPLQSDRWRITEVS